jgi:hypothetical protein
MTTMTTGSTATRTADWRDVDWKVRYAEKIETPQQAVQRIRPSA